jgi:DNA-directed RNA polymerase subunit RPC12/RpoP
MVREVECCNCRKRFNAHILLNDTKTVCPHCGERYLVMLYICPECFDILNGKDPPRKPYRCPVCNGRGMVEEGSCPACAGKGIVWWEGSEP